MKKSIFSLITVLMLLILACEKQESEEISIEGVYKDILLRCSLSHLLRKLPKLKYLL